MAETEYDLSELTVDEVEETLKSTDYSIDELREIRGHETSRDDPRTTALEAIDEEIAAATSGPDVPGDDEDEVDSAIYSYGAGATEQGQPTAALPDPYDADAPDTVRIHVPTSMGLAGVLLEERGTHTVDYTKRLQTALLTDTNAAVLSTTDPHHPENAED